MKTDKLYYRIFLSQPESLAEFLPGVPENCQFEYSAPVVKETEFRLDGLLTPISEDPLAPLVFIEAQMQRDPDFYSRFFAEVYTYLHQYKVKQPWRGLLIFQSREQMLGDASLYTDFAMGKVECIYLQDLISRTQLSPTLALLQLIALPKVETSSAAQNLLKTARNQSIEAFQKTLDLVEAILINKFPQLSTKEILAMLDLKTADVRQTRFYQEVLQEGRQEGELKLILRQLAQRLGGLTSLQEQQVQALSSQPLEALGMAIFEFSTAADLDRWLEQNT
jgi:predicted transposase/invertase (TIGR01784 family)